MKYKISLGTHSLLPATFINGPLHEIIELKTVARRCSTKKFTVQKMKFSVTVTEEIINGKIDFLCRACSG